MCINIHSYVASFIQNVFYDRLDIVTIVFDISVE